MRPIKTLVISGLVGGCCFAQANAVTAQIAPPLSEEQLRQLGTVASAITVQIINEFVDGGYASGVLIGSGDGHCYIASAEHVFRNRNRTTYKIDKMATDLPEDVNSDGGLIIIENDSIELATPVDIALVEIVCPDRQNFEVTALGNDAPTADPYLLVSGYPRVDERQILSVLTETVPYSIEQCDRGGADLHYESDAIAEGMSGGSILNSQGQLIGIHSRAPSDLAGFRCGVPIAAIRQLVQDNPALANALNQQFSNSSGELDPTNSTLPITGSLPPENQPDPDLKQPSELWRSW